MAEFLICCLIVFFYYIGYIPDGPHRFLSIILICFCAVLMTFVIWLLFGDHGDDDE
jgi:hypothetical protein